MAIVADGGATIRGVHARASFWGGLRQSQQGAHLQSPTAALSPGEPENRPFSGHQAAVPAWESTTGAGK